MTLLLNYRPVLRQPTGIGVYANAVLPALQQLPHHLIPGGEQGTAAQRFQRLAWSQVCLPRLAERHKAALIFTPAPEGYLGPQRIPQVVMVHDLRPLSHPERSLQSVYFRHWVPPLLRSCRHVLTNSLFTAREIQRCVGLAEDQISVIPLGFDKDLFHPKPEGYSLGEAPYFLHVGQAYPHKNIRRLLHAFIKIASRHRNVKLMLVGKPHPSQSPRLQRLVREYKLEDRVEFRSYVQADELPSIYRQALAFVFPSLWEGFGLPVLEAMACGVPVITSFGSGTQEVAGEAAILIDPLSISALEDAMDAVLRQPVLREKLREAGIQRAAQFSWDFTAERTVDVCCGL